MKNLWDSFCRIAEKNNIPVVDKSNCPEGFESFRSIKSLLNSARFFTFNDPSHHFLPGNVSEGEAQDFRLPFDVVAIQDPASIVLIADIKKNQVGVNDYRLFVEYTDLRFMDPSAYEDFEVLGNRLPQKKQNIQQITIALGGGFNTEGFAGKWLILGVHVFRKEKLHTSVDGDQVVRSGFPQGSVNAIMKNLSAGLQEAVYMIQPKHFILEERPNMVRKPGVRIPRHYERSIYTLLKPGEIRKRMGLQNPSLPGSTKEPHERAGHYRTYRHERYGDKVGTKQWIKPTWIGPSEAKVGNKLYKVLLETDKKDIPPTINNETEDQEQDQDCGLRI